MRITDEPVLDMTSRIPDWRPIIAALAHDDTRTVFAQLVLGRTPSLGDTQSGARRTERCLVTLRRTGLLGEGATVEGDTLRRLLVTSAPPKATGIERFLVDGRIDRYPSNLDERERLLRHVAHEVLDRGEVIDERTLNGRLSAFHDDVAGLRRYLVDSELVERTSSGTQYAPVD